MFILSGRLLRGKEKEGGQCEDESGVGDQGGFNENTVISNDFKLLLKKN